MPQLKHQQRKTKDQLKHQLQKPMKQQKVDFTLKQHYLKDFCQKTQNKEVYLIMMFITFLYQLPQALEALEIRY